MPMLKYGLFLFYMVFSFPHTLFPHTPYSIISNAKIKFSICFFFLFHILFSHILITTSFPFPKLNFLYGLSFPYTLFPHTHYNIIFNAKIKFSIWSFLFHILFFNILITTLLLTPKLNFLDGLFFSIYSFSTYSLQHNF